MTPLCKNVPTPSDPPYPVSISATTAPNYFSPYQGSLPLQVSHHLLPSTPIQGIETLSHFPAAPRVPRLNWINLRFKNIRCLTQEDVLSRSRISNWTLYIELFILLMSVAHIITCNDIHSITEKRFKLICILYTLTWYISVPQISPSCIW